MPNITEYAERSNLFDPSDFKEGQREKEIVYAKKYPIWSHAIAAAIGGVVTYALCRTVVFCAEKKYNGGNPMKREG